MDQIFNELSFNGTYPDQFSANEGIIRCLNLSLELSKYGFNKTIRTTKDFAQKELSPSYTTHQWATNYQSGNRDLKRHFLIMLTKSPYIEQEIHDYENLHNECLDFSSHNKLALGLGLSYLWKSFVLSLDCEPKYKTEDIEFELCKMCNGSTITTKIITISIWKQEQLPNLENKLRDCLLDSLTTGQIIVENRNILFANLKFSQTAITQLENLYGTEEYFSTIKEHLWVLNKSMQKYESGPFKPDGVDWSPEKPGTLKRYHDQRTFLCEDQESRLFNQHTKIHGANKRIYFIPIPEERIVHIGHIGDHLPTSRFPK